MWSTAIQFTANCMQQVLNWFHSLMNAVGVSDGVILGFFSALGISSLIIAPIRGKALGSDSVRLEAVATDNARRSAFQREMDRYGGERP